MQTDWYTLENPDPNWVKTAAAIPGFRWNYRAGRVASVEWHRSHARLLYNETVNRTSNAFIAADALAGRRSLTVAANKLGHPLLRDYQRNDLPFVYERRASILGYEMRLGKTATAVAAHNPANGPLVIVGPLIARDTWRDWCERIHGFSPVALESKHDYPLSGFPAYFIHFDILDAHTKFFSNLKIETMVIDEIHLLQARRTQRISATSILAANAQRIIGLSGTPMWTNPRTLWPILNLLSPGAWGTQFEFSKRYTNAQQSAYGWRYEGISNEEELKLRLSEVIIRRTWKDVLGQLPPITNVVEAVELSNVERVKYESLAQRTQLANMSEGRQSTVAGYLATLRRLFGEAKIKRALELVKQGVKDGHKVVLWTWHNDVASKLYNELHTAMVLCRQLTAAQSQNDRERTIAAFQQDSQPGVLVAPLAVGGVAIDLSSADLAIFVELDWIPATIYQASMRTFSPHRPSANVYLFADVPIERRLVEVLECNEACQTAAGLGYEEIASKALSGIPSNLVGA